MIAYKWPKSLKDILVHAKIPQASSKRPIRNLQGMKKCGKCTVCPYVENLKIVKSSNDKFNFHLSSAVSCNTSNVIYAIKCSKCNQQYIGQTGRMFKDRLREHLGYIRNCNLSEPTGHHFNLPGHNLSMLKATIVEKCKTNSKMYRETREEFFIQKFPTKFKGMNRKL